MTSSGESHRADGETILLAEDDESLRRLAARVLRNAGYRVLEATNGEDALNGSGDHGQIDLLITDVEMPKMGGGELARRLCARDPDLRVVYMSGYSEAALKKHVSLTPEAAWLTKPFSPSDLLREARSQLDAAQRKSVGK
jgi:two-component system cell cycle sensor histidine kinase/response regulator CckA